MSALESTPDVLEDWSERAIIAKMKHSVGRRSLRRRFENPAVPVDHTLRSQDRARLFLQPGLNHGIPLEVQHEIGGGLAHGNAGQSGQIRGFRRI